MAILLTGGSGKTSTRLAVLLQAADIPFVLASRRGQTPATPPGMTAVKFDYTNPTTYSAPFSTSAPPIRAVYLVPPSVADPAPYIAAFIAYASTTHRVARFVLLANTTAAPAGPVWSRLRQPELEYCVLRPAWFMENFSEQEHANTVRREGRLYSACGDARVPFVGAGDVAAVAMRALTDPELPRSELWVLGPELLTFDDVAEKLSKHLGRKIEHVKLTSEERIERLEKRGMPAHYAQLVAWVEGLTAAGGEDRMNDDVLQVTGRPPMSFDEFAEQLSKVWAKRCIGESENTP